MPLEAVRLRKAGASALGRGSTLTIPEELSEPREPSREPNCGKPEIGIRADVSMGIGVGRGPVSRAHLMEQVGLQQGRFITQGRMRGLCGQQQVLQERGQQLSLQRGQGGACPSSAPACGRSSKPVLRCWGGASGDAL